MKNKTNFLYDIFILATFIIGCLFLLSIYYQKDSKEKEYFNENIYTLDIAYNASVDKYHLFTKQVFNDILKNELVIPLFEKGVNSNGDIRRLYKGLLYKELYPSYSNLREEGIRQFHFHLKNNESYLRLHSPNKYGDNLSKVRETVKIANKENKTIINFETGRVMSGFRNVFPLSYKNEHIGSFEIGISTKVILDSISKLDNRREYSFILKKDIVFPKLFENHKNLYQKSIINSNFVIEDKYSSLPDSPKKLSPIAKKINEVLMGNKELKEVMNKGKKYGLFVYLDSTYYDVTFIPMWGVSKKIEGYLIAYKKSMNIPFLITNGKYIYFLVLLGMISMIIMIFIIKKKTIIFEEQKKWFKSITDELGEGLYVMNKNAIVTYVNPIACEILGYKEEEIIGKNAHILFHSHSLNNNSTHKDCPIFNGVMKTKSFSSREESFLTSDGKNIPVSLNSRMISNDDKEVQIITSFLDISIQKKLEEKSNLLTKALESSINCVVITDKNAIIQWVNPAFERLSGFKAREIIGKNPKEFTSSGEHTQEFYQQMWKTILSKKPWKGEVINKRKDGTLYDEELIITPVLDEDGDISNFVAVKQDISDRKIIALEKEQKDILFYQQSKMAAMGEMLGNVAHQWRQPLSLISSTATGSKLEKELNLLSDEDFYLRMDNINNSAQFLSQTIDTFRSFFNPSNSKKMKFDIANTIEKTLNLISSQFVSKDITIIQNIKNFKIISSENELIQVLVNILNNSRDVLIQINNQKRLIFINTFRKENLLYIEILDNGGGVDKEIINRIFEPYFTTKHQSQGTGIGLYMSQDIIKNHLNGNIIVSNESFTHDNIKYMGAKFTITILLDD